MNKLIYTTCLILLSAAVKVNTLQCYQCVNCAKVTDADLVTCGSSTTSTPGTGTTATGAPGTTAPATPAPETPATGTPATQTPATQTPATQTPATQPPATQPPATEAPATQPPATQPPATEAPATQPPATEAPATESPGALSHNLGSNFLVTRVRRSSDEVLVKEDKYVCAQSTEKVNDTEVVMRGCLIDAGDGKTCTNAGLSSSCKTCDTDKCNAAVSLQVSAIMLLSVFFVTIV